MSIDVWPEYFQTEYLWPEYFQPEYFYEKVLAFTEKIC